MYIFNRKNLFLVVIYLLLLFIDVVNAEKFVINFYLFSVNDCNKCYNVKYVLFPTIEKRYNVKLNYKEFNTINRKNFELLLKIKNFFKEELAEVPVIIINNKYIAGYDKIEDNFAKIIKEIKENDTKTEFFTIDDTDKINNRDVLKIVPLITVLSAGLIDGINPCAFATIIFLISYLTYIKKTRKNILAIGIFYTIAVFVSYILIGLGFFKFITTANWFHSFSKGINILFSIILFILAIISFKDFLLSYKGKSKEMVLQLSKNLKLKIHNIIRANLQNRILIFGSIIIGVIVSLIELSCTGQIYLPTIVYIAKSGKLIGYVLIFLYNLMFILPLIIVFIIFYKGVSSNKIKSFFQKHIVVIKLFTTILFFVLAVLLFIRS